MIRDPGAAPGLAALGVWDSPAPALLFVACSCGRRIGTDVAHVPHSGQAEFALREKAKARGWKYLVAVSGRAIFCCPQCPVAEAT